MRKVEAESAKRRQPKKPRGPHRVVKRATVCEKSTSDSKKLGWLEVGERVEVAKSRQREGATHISSAARAPGCAAAPLLLRLLRVWAANARVPWRSGYPVQDLSAPLSPPCRQQRRRLFRLRLGVARRQGRQHAARAGAPVVRATRTFSVAARRIWIWI